MICFVKEKKARNRYLFTIHSQEKTTKTEHYLLMETHTNFLEYIIDFSNQNFVEGIESLHATNSDFQILILNISNYKL